MLQSCAPRSGRVSRFRLVTTPDARHSPCHRRGRDRGSIALHIHRLVPACQFEGNGDIAHQTDGNVYICTGWSALGRHSDAKEPGSRPSMRNLPGHLRRRTGMEDVFDSTMTWACGTRAALGPEPISRSRAVRILRAHERRTETNITEKPKK